jgi:hypothetical protein
LGTDPLTCVPRTSCRAGIVVQLAQTAMAYMFVVWMLSAGHAPVVAGGLLASVLLLVGVAASWKAGVLRSVLPPVLEAR